MTVICEYCNQASDGESRTCPYCGAALPIIETASAAADASAASGAAGLSDYRLVLVSCGTCSKSTARSLLQDILGYSRTEAYQLTDQLPAEIAGGLTQAQALDLSRTLTEYGLNVALYRGTDYTDLGDDAQASVFGDGGSLLPSVLATLATLTMANRVRRILPWPHPAPEQHLFRPRFTPGPAPAYQRPAIRRPRVTGAPVTPRPAQDSKPQGGYHKPSQGGNHKPSQGGYRKSSSSQGGPGQSSQGGYRRSSQGGQGAQGGYHRPSSSQGTPGGYRKSSSSQGGPGGYRRAGQDSGRSSFGSRSGNSSFGSRGGSGTRSNGSGRSGGFGGRSGGSGGRSGGPGGRSGGRSGGGRSGGPGGR